MKTVHAFTETHVKHPGHVIISEGNDGRISVTVRTRGGQVPSTITMTREELAGMSADVAAYLAPAETEVMRKARGD